MVAPTSDDLVRAIPGLTYRRLDYWIRQGYIPDHDHLETTQGYPRTFTPHQVLVLRHMTALVNEGVKVEAAATAAAHAERLASGEWRYRMPSALSDTSVLTMYWRLPQSQTADAEHVVEVGLP